MKFEEDQRLKNLSFAQIILPIKKNGNTQTYKTTNLDK